MNTAETLTRLGEIEVEVAKGNEAVIPELEKIAASSTGNPAVLDELRKMGIRLCQQNPEARRAMIIQLAQCYRVICTCEGARPADAKDILTEQGHSADFIQEVEEEVQRQGGPRLTADEYADYMAAKAMLHIESVVARLPSM